MAVQFYPDYPISFVEKKLYSILESGNKNEWIIYRELLIWLTQSTENWYVWYNHHSLVEPQNNIDKNTESDSYFIILNQRGIVVLKVNTGEIEVTKQDFFIREGNNLQKISNPLSQAKQYKYLVRKQFLKQFNQVLLTEAIALPSTIINNNTSFVDKALIYSKQTKENQKQNIETFLISVLEKQKEKYSFFHQFKFQTLSEDLLETIAKKMNINRQEEDLFETPNTAEWLGVNNTAVLQALSCNPRIMIKGKAGTGKTTLAYTYADQNRDLKGLFVCSSLFLQTAAQNKFNEREINIKVINYNEFVIENNKDLSPQKIKNLSYDEFAIKTKIAIENYLANNGERFDYIIVDEAEELFDKNLDTFLDKMCVTGNGLLQGKSVVLYDFKQSFNNRLRENKEFAQLIRSSFVHYKLKTNKRNSANKEIIELALDADYQPKDIMNMLYYKNKAHIRFHEITTEKDFQKLISNYETDCTNSAFSFNNNDTIFLVQAKLLKQQEFVEKIFKQEGIYDFSTQIVSDNTLPKYTTPIKFKGLERKHVILIVGKPNKISSHEWYVGITRAVENIDVIHINIKK